MLARRHPFGGLAPLRRRHRRQLWLSGLLTAFLLLVPVVNLLAPIVGSAFVTLRLHRAGLGVGVGGNAERIGTLSR